MYNEGYLCKKGRSECKIGVLQRDTVTLIWASFRSLQGEIVSTEYEWKVVEITAASSRTSKATPSHVHVLMESWKYGVKLQQTAMYQRFNVSTTTSIQLSEIDTTSVPQCCWHYMFTNPTVSAIRKSLSVPEPTAGSRVLYIRVFHKLYPITKLHGKKLFGVWHQCILCMFSYRIYEVVR